MSSDYACDGCGTSGVPLLEAADDRSLCLKCVEASPNLAGVEVEAVEMLRWLSKLPKPEAD